MYTQADKSVHAQAWIEGVAAAEIHVQLDLLKLPSIAGRHRLARHVAPHCARPSAGGSREAAFDRSRPRGRGPANAASRWAVYQQVSIF